MTDNAIAFLIVVSIAEGAVVYLIGEAARDHFVFGKPLPTWLVPIDWAWRQIQTAVNTPLDWTYEQVARHRRKRKDVTR